MNTSLSLPNTAKPAASAFARPRRATSDNEFLAPALEILETPLSPVRAALIWIICALVVVALAWSYLGRVEIIATAQGKFQPTGRVKVVEPLETGKVSSIFVTNGARVAAGDILVELDRSEAEADRNSASAGLASAMAESARRIAAIAAAKARQFEAAPQISWSADVPAALRERETRVLDADLGQLTASITSLAAQRSQKQREREKLAQTIASQQNLIATLQQRVDMRQSLVDLKSGAKAAVIDATETLQYQLTQLSIQQGQLASLDGGVDVTGKDLDKTIETFISVNAQKLSDSEQKAEDLEQRLAKAAARLDHLTLRAPIAGVVQASIVSNVGQVVSSGQEVMRVVPENSGLEIEAYVLNKDIGFVKVGQEAAIKIESFPFARYGTVAAHVTRIARDAIPEPDANLLEGDPSHATKNSTFAGAQRVQNLVFPVVLTPDAADIEIDGQPVPLTSGMTAIVELKTGTRRMLEYIFSPLVEVGAGAMKER